MICFVVLSHFIERIYGSARVFAVLALAPFGGNFIGALADDICSVVCGISPLVYGLMGAYVITIGILLLNPDVHPITPKELVMPTLVSLLELVHTTSLAESSHVTNFCALIAGAGVLMFYLPSFLREEWQLMAPLVGALAILVLFVIMPIVYHVRLGDPTCMLSQ